MHSKIEYIDIICDARSTLQQLDSYKALNKSLKKHAKKCRFVASILPGFFTLKSYLLVKAEKIQNESFVNEKTEMILQKRYDAIFNNLSTLSKEVSINFNSVINALQVKYVEKLFSCKQKEKIAEKILREEKFNSSISDDYVLLEKIEAYLIAKDLLG